MTLERLAVGALSLGLLAGVLGALARLGLTAIADARALAAATAVVAVVALLVARGLGAPDETETPYW